VKVGGAEWQRFRSRLENAVIGFARQVKKSNDEFPVELKGRR
jgi:hypothetical protein